MLLQISVEEKTSPPESVSHHVNKRYPGKKSTHYTGSTSTSTSMPHQVPDVLSLTEYFTLVVGRGTWSNAKMSVAMTLEDSKQQRLKKDIFGSIKLPY